MSVRTSKLAMTALAALLAGASACSAASALDGTWRLVSIGGQEISAGATQVPYFTVRGADIMGYDGCNQFSGRLDVPASIVKTQRACADGGVELPLDLANLELELKAAVKRGNRLSFPARGKFPPAVFARDQ